MSKFEKLLERILSLPADFTYQELVRLLNGFGYDEYNKGRTSGSRVKFYNEKIDNSIVLHKPHPGNIIKEYALKQVLMQLVNAGLIKTTTKNE